MGGVGNADLSRKLLLFPTDVVGVVFVYHTVPARAEGTGQAGPGMDGHGRAEGTGQAGPGMDGHGRAEGKGQAGPGMDWFYNDFDWLYNDVDWCYNDFDLF